MLSTLIYTVIKGAICIYNLPGSSINVVVQWLQNQAITASKSVSVFIKLAKAILECSVSLGSCLNSVMYLFYDLIGASFSWLRLSISYFIPLNVDFNNLKTYDPGLLYKFFGSDTDLHTIVLSSNAVDREVLNNTIAQAFPTAGIKFMKWVIFTLFGSFVSPEYYNIFSKLEQIVNKGILTYSKLQAILKRFKGNYNLHLKNFMKLVNV
jgi:hypothetical protein